MSKTIRRKGYESTAKKVHGSKTAGYFTIQEGWWFYYNKSDEVTFREPTRQEYFKAFWKLHGDSQRNAWCPSRSYRHPRTVENRMINKQELIKWLKNEDYEPLFEDNPRSCLWDWS